MDIQNIVMEGIAMVVVAAIGWSIVVVSLELSDAVTYRWFPAICLCLVLVTCMRLDAPMWLMMLMALLFVIGVQRFAIRGK